MAGLYQSNVVNGLIPSPSVRIVGQVLGWSGESKRSFYLQPILDFAETLVSSLVYNLRGLKNRGLSSSISLWTQFRKPVSSSMSTFPIQDLALTAKWHHRQSDIDVSSRQPPSKLPVQSVETHAERDSAKHNGTSPKTRATEESALRLSANI
jgi:hypothetical protein